MKKSLGLLITFLIAFAVNNAAEANLVDKELSNSQINKSAVSISVKDITGGKNVYEHNAKVPMHPASTQKIITLTASREYLKDDYKFTTSVYKDNKNNLYVKLGGDPYLASRDLRRMMKTAKAKKVLTPEKVYVDESIMDNIEWGEGWQWDDDINPLMPKFSSYNLDGNLLEIIIGPTIEGTPADIHLNVFYPITFMNLVTTGKTNHVTISKDSDIAPNVLKIEGEVHTQFSKYIPVSKPRLYFMLQLENALKSAKVKYYESIKTSKLPSQNVYLIDSTTHLFTDAVNDILYNSNNMAAETVFKLAGGQYAKGTGTTAHSLDMLNEYFIKEELNADNIRIVDGSGVSKNNLMTADFMTDFLVKQAKKEDFEKFKNELPTAGEGTLKDRMLYFQKNLRAKTGTLADVSAITGYITAKSGKTYAFDIMINDAKTKSTDKKMLEEYILRAVYNSY